MIRLLPLPLFCHRPFTPSTQINAEDKGTGYHRRGDAEWAEYGLYAGKDMPHFNGNIQQFIKTQLKYPADAKARKKKGNCQA